MKLPANRTLIGVAALFLSVTLLALAFVFTAVDRDTLAETMPAVAASPVAQEAAAPGMPQFANEAIKEDVLWLARAIYSETKRPDEQELVAWVVRNRVETNYRGATTYKEVVLDPWQFSAFNRNSPKRNHYMRLNEHSRARGWATAVAIAYDVIHAPAYERPFSIKTRHFYSERSMVGRRHPDWARGQRPVALDRPVDPRRFRFFAEIS